MTCHPQVWHPSTTKHLSLVILLRDSISHPREAPADDSLTRSQDSRSARARGAAISTQAPRGPSTSRQSAGFRLARPHSGSQSNTQDPSRPSHACPSPRATLAPAYDTLNIHGMMKVCARRPHPQLSRSITSPISAAANQHRSFAGPRASRKATTGPITSPYRPKTR